MGIPFWEAAAIVMRFVEAEGSCDKVISYHDRGMRHFAAYLEETGAECTRESAELWLEQGRCVWSRCKFKENRTAVRRLVEAMETGRVVPSPYSHPGPTDYSKLSGWSRESVDAYAEAAEERFSEQEGRLCRMYASQFLACSGLEDASPDDITADAIVGYTRECGGTKCVRAARLSHLRGFLSSLAERGEAPEWAPMLASDRFASKAECFARFDAPDGGGEDPAICIELADGFAGALESAGYVGTSLKSARRMLGMLYIALSLNGFCYTRANAEAWLEAAAPHIGTQKPAYSRAIRLFDGFASNGAIDTSVLRGKVDPMAGAPGWAVDGISEYLQVKSREGCSDGTVACARRACVRLASYADSAGIRSWADIDPVTVTAWCTDDPHSTAEGRACYVGKARGLLQYLGDEGIAPAGVWLAAWPERAATRKAVEVLDDSDVALADEARISAASPMELRDAAVIALGLTMGLRSCDVLRLRMSDISWTRSAITIVQKKTGAQLDLPLTVAAGNAVAAYIRRGRPESPSPLVFVKHRAPYDGLTRCACREALVRTFGPHVTGFHILRRTFATSMLRGGAGRRGVSEALGHRTELSTRPYLSLDAGRMRMCALSPAECGIGGGHD